MSGFFEKATGGRLVAELIDKRTNMIKEGACFSTDDVAEIIDKVDEELHAGVKEKFLRWAPGNTQQREATMAMQMETANLVYKLDKAIEEIESEIPKRMVTLGEPKEIRIKRKELAEDKNERAK